MLELKTLFTILHIFGAIIGAGAAYTSDYNFFFMIRDKKLNRDEISFLEKTGRLVWIGLVVSILSGIGLFLGNPTTYLASSKFITKMIIVLIIIINGAFFHLSHIPNLKKCVNQNLKHNRLFKSRRNLFLLSGAISVVSWTATIVLGSLRSIPYSVESALVSYFVVIILAFLVAQKITKKYF